MKCSQCGRELVAECNGPDWVASISGSVMGDEESDTYYFCRQCGMYTVEYGCDRFCGEETASVGRPLSKAEGDALVEIIRRCSRPWNKKCRCKAHMEYFRGRLD